MFMHKGLVDNSEHFENKLTDNWLREESSSNIAKVKSFSGCKAQITTSTGRL